MTQTEPVAQDETLDALPTSVGPGRRLVIGAAWVAAIAIAVVAGLAFWRTVLGSNPTTMERFRKGGGVVYTSRTEPRTGFDPGFTATFPVRPSTSTIRGAAAPTTITQATLGGSTFSVTGAEATDAELTDPTAALSQAVDALVSEVKGTVVDRSKTVNFGAVLTEVGFRHGSTSYRARLIITVDRFFIVQMAGNHDDATLFHIFANTFHPATVR